MTARQELVRSGAIRVNTTEAPARDGKRPFLSFILCTLGHRKSIGETLASLKAQSQQSFEVIIVEQGEKPNTCLETANQFSFARHIGIERVGLSHARNVGIPVASGSYVAFLDDDVTYPVDFVERLAKRATEEEHNICFLLRVTDPNRGGQPNLSGMRKTRTKVGVRFVLNSVMSVSIAAPLKAILTIGGFDEHFGMGELFAGGADSDLALRLWLSGSPCQYEPEIEAYHPFPDKSSYRGKQELNKRAFCYGKGQAAMFCKFMGGNTLGVLLFLLWAEKLIRAAGSSAIALLAGNRHYAIRQAYLFAGRLLGILDWHRVRACYRESNPSS